MRDPKSTISPLSEEVTHRLSRFRLPDDDAPSPARITVRKNSVIIKIEHDIEHDPDYRHWFNQGEVDLCCVILGPNGSWWDCNQKHVPVKNKAAKR